MATEKKTAEQVETRHKIYTKYLVSVEPKVVTLKGRGESYTDGYTVTKMRIERDGISQEPHKIDQLNKRSIGNKTKLDQNVFYYFPSDHTASSIYISVEELEA